VVNEPHRRGRTVGTDLLGRFTDLAPVDWFGMGADELPGARRMGDLPQDRMLTELARRRVYLHLTRWTSLGLSLLEAMHLGMPVVALGSTEVHEAVPPGAGVVSTDVDRLRAAARQYLNDPDAARAAGTTARAHARDRYGLDRFLGDWDRLMKEVVR
jgi:glycosyltransferase involved in cell wall biosynthesis